MLIIGLTGGVGSGKSAAAELFAGYGAGVVDTDVIARHLVVPGAPALKAIAAQLGGEYILPDGSLDRARLRQRVFNDPVAKARLEAILHPLIRREAASQAVASRTPYTLIVVPLLVESGSYRDLVRRVLVVDCSEQVQLERTMVRSGLPEAEVRAIMNSQASRQVRLNCADDVIDNNGDWAALERQARVLHEKYLGLALSAS